jgi:N-methylhydantoinase A
VLRVGPQSAGAVPGPVCYGNGGTEPTITDANVILGYMNPESIAGGTVAVDRAGALTAFERALCPRLGMSALEAAHGVHTVANAAMMRAIRAVTTERGRDPREYALVAFGGAGPIHAAGLAASLGMRRVHVPLHPGVFSALGLLLADVRYDYVRSIPGPLESLDLGELEATFEALAGRVVEAIGRERIAPESVLLERFLDLRYRGQTSELTLRLPGTVALPTGAGSGATGSDALDRERLAELFHREHEINFGYRSASEPIVVVNLRLKALAPSSSATFAEVASGFRRRAGPDPAEHRREAYFGAAHGTLETRILERAGLAGRQVEGPVIVEEPDTTVVIPPGWRAGLDDLASIVLERVD